MSGSKGSNYYREAGITRSQVRDLLNTLLEETPQHLQQVLISETRMWCDARQPSPPPVTSPPKASNTFPLVTYTDKEAQTFEQQLLKFGKYADTPWRDVPHTYLNWLLGNNLPMIKYLYSDYYKRKQEANERHQERYGSSEDTREEPPF